MHEDPVDVPAGRSTSPQDDGPHPHRWRILAVTLVVGFMSLLDVTIVNVAIPSIQEGLDTTPGTVQWVVSGYALTFGLTLVAGGRLGDAYGRRRLMLIGLAGFVASSAAAGLAPTAELVVVARLLQGASAGFLTPQSSGLIQQLFSGAERGRAFGYFGLTVSIASATGPLLGGLVIGLVGEDLGWRLLFLVNVPIGLVAAIAVARMVPGRQSDGGPGRIDVPGAVLLGLSVLCLLYPLVSLESGARWPLVLLVGVPLFGWAFAAWEHRLKRRGHEPLLDLDLLRRLPGFGNGMLVGTVYFTGFTGVFLVASVWLQGSRDVSALHAGLLLTPFALGSAITSPLAGRLVSTVGRSLTVGALGVMMVGVLGAALVAPGRPTEDLWWALAPFLLLAGLGGGAVVSPNITLTLQEVPPRMGGAAGGALQTGQRIGSSLGAALLATTYQVVAGGSGGDTGIRVALFVALAVLALALAASVMALRSSRRLAAA
ncbi:MFS transporter [Aeromicrobium sp. Leaf272]|uniref:MFS transporter n=1 Tax=Aeromicrobium sp. Leaf272 TaxID=1736317 RepID=UPI0006FE4E22|nr:MFS transporter [Aeromicrobium sp. Leaf272]KQP26804.1 MFS transporter [Aeromicrobium sp. Leaf272]